MDGLKHTPLYETHLALGGKMVDFGGWALPVQYASILEEHKAVRERVGLFDVSHMGEIEITGLDMFEFLQHLLTNDFTTLQAGSCRYSPMCYPNGGTVDDVIVYKYSNEKVLVVVNASNTDKDFEWMRAQSVGFRVKIENHSASFAQLALQGPQAEQMLAPLCDEALPEKNYTFTEEINVAGIGCMVSRTGYTGEDGFELYCLAQDGAALHAALMKAGAAFDMLPCGLGARDTLRFEAGMPLYGHEITQDISPREAGLNFAVKLDKADFIGRNALMDAPRHKRVGMQITDRGIAREHCEIFVGERKVGETTSGGPSPTLGGNFVMALVEAEAADAPAFSIIVRGRHLAAQRVALPFYKRAK